MTEPKLRAEWFWTDRWFASSACCLPIDARGLYRELLTRAWSLGGKLPANHGILMRLAGVTREEWDRCWPLVAPYWKVRDGKLVNDTQLEVMDTCRKHREKLSERGRKGAAARWKNSQAEDEQVECLSNAQAKQPQCPPSPSLSQSKEPSQSPAPTEETCSDATRPLAGKPARNGTSAPPDVRDVFAYFQAQHPKARLSAARQKLIGARLRDGYSVDDLKLAIDGLHLSKWHTASGNLTLEYGIRNSDKIEKLQEVATNQNHADRIGRPEISEQSRRAVDAVERFVRRHTEDE